MNSPLIACLLSLLDEAFDKPGWQGPNLMSAIRGIDAVTAARPIIPGRKSIWQQILHAAFWKQRVLNQLVGTQRFPRSPGNWPDIPTPPTPAAWKADIGLLRQIHARLRAAVAGLDDRDLTPRLLKFIRGAALHDLYHTGQIALLRRHLRDATPRRRRAS